MSQRKIVIGSRESRLAVIQSEMVKTYIEEKNKDCRVELLTMKTTGDKILDRTLDKVGGKGLFVKELDRALEDGRTMLSVHSLKDMPMEVSEELPLIAFSKRQDPRDVLVLPEGVDALDPEKPIGCSSLRRTLQLKELFPDMTFASVRGNVQTRLRKLEEGQYDAIVLAAAGLDRLELSDENQWKFEHLSSEVCLPAAGQAILAVEKPQYTSVCLLVDKEEIGSVGASGMQSRFFENCVAEVLNLAGNYSELAVRRALKNSKVLSSDVSAAFDPNYPSVMEKRNSAFFGKGLVFNKYTGSRGKSGSNDANAEYVAKLRNIMDTNEVSFQTAELGKVDQGGGGTIAYILANYDMNVIDSGVAVLNMHAPWEIISKVDLYEAYRGYIAFLKEA